MVVQIESSANKDLDKPLDVPASVESQNFNTILRYIEKCNREHNIDRKIQLLKFINSVLPNEIQLRIPSLITDDYVESALYNLEMACKGRIKLKNYFLVSL